MTAAKRLFPADPGVLTAINEWLRAQGEGFAMWTAVAFKMELCVEEIVTNAIKYGFVGDTAKDGWVEIGLLASGGGLKLCIADNALPFNPLEHVQNAPPTSLESAPIGGLGIHLVRELAETVRYDRIGGRNVLTIEFAAPAPP
ncbi:MAG: ATP-binding protein [Novosphingobium sp.]|jgi:serine/threonine-protein kinase RsbW|uniref:ATP-binding protein n=1 Tax=Novosphingobium sp. TaxID=1874826 RepID=UPI003018A0AB